MAACLLTPAASAQPNWWPDPFTHRGLSVWVPYSRQYDTLWSDHNLADQEIGAIAAQGVDVVFVALSRPHLEALSDRANPVTADVQYLLNQLSAGGMMACASILSDQFFGSDSQMQNYVLVDHLLDFNASLGDGDAGFPCVSTDYELTPGSQTSSIYDRWKLFHANMQDRIAAGGGGLALLAWIEGPDYLIAALAPDDRDQLMTREGITQDPSDSSLYDGAFRYFFTQDGAPIFDAVIPMWYFTPPGPYYRRLDHNIQELEDLGISNLYLIAGVMVRDTPHGVCCSGCVSGRADYDARLSYNDMVRAQFPNFIGTGVFLWPIPDDWTCP